MINDKLFETYNKQAPKHISISQLRKFVKCGVQYYYDYLAGEPKKPGDRMLLGNVVHAGLAQANHLRMNCSPLDMDIIHGAARAEFDKLTGSCVYTYDMWGSAEGVYNQSGKILSKVVNTLDNLTGLPMLVEHPIEQTPAGGSIIFEGGIYLTGWVDLVDCNGSIYDFKVGSKPKTQVEADQDLQLSLYTYAIHGLPSEPVKVGLICPSSKDGSITARESSRNKDSVEAAFDATNQTVKMMRYCIDNHIFFPNTEGWWCSSKWCDFFSTCPFGCEN